MFDTGAADRLRSTGAVTLEWKYRYRNRTVTHSTRFLPVRYSTRHYYPYGPYYPYGSYFQFGFHFGGHHGHHYWH